MLKQIKKTINIDNLLKNIDLPLKNKSLFYLEFNGLCIFDVVLNISFKEEIEKIELELFRISKGDLILLEELKNKKLDSNFVYDLILSDSIPQMVLGTFNYLNANSNFNVIYKNTHAKICKIKTKYNFYYIYSSGNFNPDGKIESLFIINK